MKLLETIIEIILSPFSFLIKLSESKFFLNNYSKTFVILIISIITTMLLILYFYRDIIFS